MCWNHVVCCCFHREKRKIQKKTRRFQKSLTSYLHNGSTLWQNSNWFLKLQCRATTFVFWPFLVIGHVTNIPIWTLTCKIIIMLFFFTFWSNQVRFPFLGIYRGPWNRPWHWPSKQYLTSYTLFYFFFWFFCDFLTIFG
jgi:hypothetical protein